MLDKKKMLQPHEVYDAVVINQLPTGCSFAQLLNSDDQTFISATASRMAGIGIGDYVRVHVIPNRSGGQTRWFTIFVQRSEDVAPQIIAMDEDEALALLQEGPLTAGEIGEEMGLPAASALSYMRGMHRAGRVACADIFDGNRKHVETLWGVSVAQLLGEEE